MKSSLLICLAFMLLAPPLTAAELPAVRSGVYRWADHEVVVDGDRETRKILEGSSPHLAYLEIHATTQAVGAKPRPAHANEDIEELILVTRGLVKFTLDQRSEIVGAGSVVSLLPQQMHSLENVGDEPLTYFVMRYRSRHPMDLARGAAARGTLLVNVNDTQLTPSARGGGRKYFDRATAMCERLELHTTQLHRQGPSHEPHEHAETELILVIAGQTEMTIAGERYEAGPGDFYFVAADLHHGVGNATEQPCSYFALKWK